MKDCRTVWGFPQINSATVDCGVVKLNDLIFRRTSFPPVTQEWLFIVIHQQIYTVQKIPRWWIKRCNCLDLCLKHNTDFNTNLVGSRTQFSVSYSSALLVPCWQLMSFCVHAGPVAWIMLFLVRQLTFLRVG